MEWIMDEFFGKALVVAAVIFCLLNIFAIPLWCFVSSWTYLFCLKKAALIWLAIIGVGACFIGLHAIADATH